MASTVLFLVNVQDSPEEDKRYIILSLFNVALCCQRHLIRIRNLSAFFNLAW
jgi:hypothetical protein